MEPDLFSAAERRDEALERVTENAGPDFAEKVRRYVLGLPRDAEFTGEDIRLAMEAAGEHPHHHNAWGGITSRMVTSGLLVKTGEWRKMRGPRSNARSTPVYRRA